MKNAKWITHPLLANLEPINVFGKEINSDRESKSKFKNTHMLFVRHFDIFDEPCAKDKSVHSTNLGQAVANAIISITADDVYKLYINGRFVANGASPSYPNRYYYNDIDISEYLVSGKNYIAVHVYYSGLINRVYVSGDNNSGLWLQLKVGNQTLIKSDEDFYCGFHSGYSSDGTVGYNTQFSEIYDSNALEAKFYLPSFDYSHFCRAAKRQNANYNLLVQPTKVCDIYPFFVYDNIDKPQKANNGSVSSTKDGFLIDLGQEIVGYVQVGASGIKGEKILVQYGEELNDDGSVRYKMRCNCDYEDTLVLSGGEDESNFFDYKAFRYVQIVSHSSSVKNIKVFARHYPFKLTTQCKYTDKNMQDIFKLCQNTIKFGVQDIYPDCPHREKGQYSGDACYTALAHYVLTGKVDMMRKFIDDFASTAFICKGLMGVSVSSFMQEIADFSLMFPHIAYVYYKITGNMTALNDDYKTTCDMLDYFARFEDADGLLVGVDKWNLVDWPAPARDGYDYAGSGERDALCGKHNAINAYYIGAQKTALAIAKSLNINSNYDKKVQMLEKSYYDEFFCHKKGLFVDNKQSNHVSLASNVLPLLFDIAQNQQIQANTIQLIKQKRLNHSNLFITPIMLLALKRIGQTQLLNDLICDPNGWLNIIAQGGTTTFEAFGKEKKWNTSLFHPCNAFPAVFISKRDIFK